MLTFCLPPKIIDGEASRALLIELCKIAMQANPVMAESAERIEKAVKRGDVTVPLLFEALAADDKAPLEKSARDMNADAGVLSFLTYNSTAPSILRCVAHLATVIPQDAVWTANGVRPVCGSAPGMATLEKEGKRFLTCHFCRYAWTVPRTLCPFCGNEDQKEMKYFYSEEEPEYRVNTCDHCQTYLKTVDTRKLDRILYLPLEQAATLHLDLMAQKKGYRQPAFFCIDESDFTRTRSDLKIIHQIFSCDNERSSFLPQRHCVHPRFSSSHALDPPCGNPPWCPILADLDHRNG